jgi:hypothetical protein
MLSLHHQPKLQFQVSGSKFHVRHPQLETRNVELETYVWWLWVESNHQPRAYETLALIPLELHSRF